MCNEFSGQDSDLSLLHSEAPRCIKKPLSASWDALVCSDHSLSRALPTGTRLNFSSDFSNHKTCCLCPYVRLSFTEPYENVSPERTYSSQRATHSPWKASGPNSQAPAVLPWHNDMIQKHLLWDGGTNLTLFWELWSLSYTLRTLPLWWKMQLRPSLWPRMGETIREALGHAGGNWSKVPRLNILIQKSHQRWFWVEKQRNMVQYNSSWLR